MTWQYRVLLDQADIAKAMWAEVSPDGQLVAFVSDRHKQDDIYVVRSDGSGLRRLTVAVKFWAAGGDPCTIAGTPGSDHLRGTSGDG